jgi:hypothetical protein
LPFGQGWLLTAAIPFLVTSRVTREQARAPAVSGEQCERCGDKAARYAGRTKRSASRLRIRV